MLWIHLNEMQARAMLQADRKFCARIQRLVNTRVQLYRLKELLDVAEQCCMSLYTLNEIQLFIEQGWERYNDGLKTVACQQYLEIEAVEELVNYVDKTVR